MEQLIESWFINNRINIYLLEAIPEIHLGCKSLAKGRSVAEMFAHIHKTRLMWLKPNDEALYKAQTVIETGEAVDKSLLLAALPESAGAIAGMVRGKESQGKRVSGFKPHNAAFLSYLIAHESHHRGQIMLILKQAGHPVDKGIAYGMWEWGAR